MSAASCSLDTEGALKDADGGLGGNGGSGASVNCWGNEWKICDGECRNVTDAEYGCGSTVCSPCALPNATPKCDGNVCKIDTCLAGYQDCDTAQFNHDATGCETNLSGDPANCGACGNACFTINPEKNWECDQGTCRESNCALGKADCDKQGECETSTDADPANCGYCGNACNLPNATPKCVAAPQPTIGECQIDSCNPGWADCDTAQANHHATGCEINITNDVGNCGACGTTCTAPTNGIPTCDNGNCTFVCTAPYIKCGNVCVDPNNDVNNCNGCGNVCPQPAGSVATCSGAKCNFNCTNPPTKCGNVCVDTNTNNSHCGTCNNQCSAPIGGSVQCSGGGCAQSCPAGQQNCSGTCVNTQTNNQNCGSCGTTCNNGKVCQSGGCACPSGTPVDCGTSCQAQCCGNAQCSGGKVCQGGSCICPSGTTTCGGTCCTGGKTCQGGACLCPPGSYDCGGTCQQCCNAGQCGTGKTCSNNTCVCDATHPQNCGSYCAEQCCDNGDCMSGPVGSVCLPGGTCGCPTGTKNCSGTCQQCCTHGECSGATPKCCSGVCGNC